MNRKFLFLCVLIIPWNIFAARYVFIGENYNDIVGTNYTVQMRLNGYLEFTEALDSQTSYFAKDIIGYSFNDGIQTFDETNSELTLVRIYTDANAIPFTYRLKFTKTPLPNAPGEVFSEISMYFGWNTEGFERYGGSYNEICLTPGEVVCALYDDISDSGGYSSPGLGGAPLPNWSLAGAGSFVPIPTNNLWSLLLLIIIILACHQYKFHRMPK